MIRKIAISIATGAVTLLFGTSVIAQGGEEELSGEVVEVSVPNDTITVDLESGDRRTYTVEEDTEINFEGRLSRLREGALRDVEVGDEVTLVVDTAEGRPRVRNFSRNRGASNQPSQQRAQTNQPADRSLLAQEQQEPRRLPSTATPVSVYALAGGLLLLTVAGSLRLTRGRWY